MSYNPLQVIVSPSGLLSRGLAFALDYVIIGAYLIAIFGLGAATNARTPGLLAPLFGTPWSAQLTAFVLITLPVTLYFAFGEAGPTGATWGKRQLRLQVCTVAGRRMTLSRSLGRTVLKFIPWELAHTCIWNISLAEGPVPPIYWTGLILVWLLVAANVLSVVTNRERQTLYDRIAGTTVIG